MNLGDLKVITDGLVGRGIVAHRFESTKIAGSYHVPRSGFPSTERR
jgi:hypothetical protein